MSYAHPVILLIPVPQYHLLHIFAELNFLLLRISNLSYAHPVILLIPVPQYHLLHIFAELNFLLLRISNLSYAHTLILLIPVPQYHRILCNTILPAFVIRFRELRQYDRSKHQRTPEKFPFAQHLIQ